MSERALHVVFGVGQVGHALVRRLDSAENEVRAVSRHRPRGVPEMVYEFEEPFVLDTTKYRSTFDHTVTPLSTAIQETLGWYRCRNAG